MLNAWTIVAEQLIRAAQDAGQFDNLPGFGKPIPGIDDPHDEFWWIKAKLKREQIYAVSPDVFRFDDRRWRR
jgi:DnaJ homologue, subfamily C, member 28, conserved domain